MYPEVAGGLAMFLMAFALAPFGLAMLERFTRDTQRAGSLKAAELRGPLGLLALFVVVAFAGFIGVTTGQFWLLETLLYLTVGSAMYLSRMSKVVQPDAAAVISAVVCTGAVTVGLHVFLRWLASASGRPWLWKRTLQILLLLVALFASGVAVTGLVQQSGWLIRTPEPLTRDTRRLS